MKKIFIMTIALVATLSCAEITSAGWQPYFSVGVFLPPPVAWARPPAPMVAYPGYPSYACYSPGYYGYRAWVPGYWESRWTPYGWRRVWVRGYWRYGS
jgi:hypothetical protein